MAANRIIAPYDAMWREIGCAYRALEDVRAGLKRSVHGLAQDDLDRDPGHGAPAISALLCHAGMVEAWWVLKIWRKEEIPAPWRELYDHGKLGKGPGPRGVVPARIFAWLDEVREASRLRLMKATDKDMDRQVIETREGPASLRWVLHHLLEHEAHHRGQIAMLRRIAGKPLGERDA